LADICFVSKNGKSPFCELIFFMMLVMLRNL
jgi:hypothetical protein